MGSLQEMYLKYNCLVIFGCFLTTLNKQFIIETADKKSPPQVTMSNDQDEIESNKEDGSTPPPVDPRSIAEMFSEHLDEEELKEMSSDGGIDLDELRTISDKIGRKISTKEIEKFNKLDKNKNGKIEKYEVG